MKIVITGSTGFIGRNLCERLEAEHKHEIYKANSKTDMMDLFSALNECDILYNFAAVHRPKNPIEFKQINVDYFQLLLEYLIKYNPKSKVVTMSSIQAGNGTPYGDSKIKAESLLKEYQEKTGSNIHLLRLTNCFGKYARINSHSVVATFCYNISHNIPIRIDNPDVIIRLCYIDDVVDLLISYLYSDTSTESYFDERLINSITIGELANILKSAEIQENPRDNEFVNRLYRTYFWYKELK